MKIDEILAIPAAFLLAPALALVGAMLIYCLVIKSALNYRSTAK